jgi:GDP-4-dehydro-6-deoxy-D-mannose reductase
VSGPALVTGGAGFAGRHLLERLRALGWEADAPDREQLDLLDAAAVRVWVRRVHPGCVFHLAALASVASSWRAPVETLTSNVAMTANLLEAVRSECPGAAVLVAGSGEVYGPPDRLPVGEDAPLRPQNPYAVSKAACDLLAGQYADAHGLRVVRTRAFNHAGPGQSDEYVVGTLTRQVAEAELAGAGSVVLRTGNVESARDFTDVTDVVRAYASAAELEPGAYNVCSGRSVAVSELIELVRAYARIEVRHEVDPARVREHDVREIRGSAERLRDACGWRPEIPIERTVADALDAWRERLAN